LDASGKRWKDSSKANGVGFHRCWGDETGFYLFASRYREYELVPERRGLRDENGAPLALGVFRLRNARGSGAATE
jgi:hypothetical protein